MEDGTDLNTGEDCDLSEGGTKLKWRGLCKRVSFLNERVGI